MCDKFCNLIWYFQFLGSQSNSLNLWKLPSHFSYGMRLSPPLIPDIYYRFQFCLGKSVMLIIVYYLDDVVVNFWRNILCKTLLQFVHIPLRVPSPVCRGVMYYVAKQHHLKGIPCHYLLPPLLSMVGGHFHIWQCCFDHCTGGWRYSKWPYMVCQPSHPSAFI